MKFIYCLLVILLSVSSGFTKEPLKRPQEPIAPYPYQEEEVSFENSGVILSGTLTVPASNGPFPVVILLQGSAPLDRNSALFGHKPFLVWADHLTKQGIAVLRFDKRSAGKSTGNYSISTLEDFAEDALAAVAYLKTRKEIDVKQIGLIGHSEGGMTASLAASKSKDVSFLILMAAPCVNWEKLICEQEMLMQRADKIPEEVIAKTKQLRNQVFTILKEESNRELAEGRLHTIFTQYLSQATPLQKKALESYYGPMEAQIRFFNSTVFRYNYRHEPAEILKQVKVPILALNGNLDFVVSTEQNLTQISKALKETGHPDYTIMELPKLNHAFQTCLTGSIMECAQIEETVAPSVLDILSEWILKRTLQRKDQ